MLCARVVGAAWPEHLPWILLGLRATPKEDSVVSSAELVSGGAPHTPRDFLDTAELPVKQFVQLLNKKVYPVLTRPLSYTKAGRKPLAALWSAAYVYVHHLGHMPPLAHSMWVFTEF